MWWCERLCGLARVNSSMPTEKPSQMSKISHQEGVVLRSYPFGEGHRIVVLLSPERGKLRTVARGVRRVKSRLRGRLEPFMSRGVGVASRAGA